MAIIPLAPASNGFMPIPEGRHVLQINAVKYDEKTGKLQITLKNRDGLSHVERYSLLKDRDTVNEKAMAVFSYLARAALGRTTIEQVDPEQLIGCFIETTVEHNTFPKTDGSEGISVKLTNTTPSYGWATVPTPEPEVNPAPVTENGAVDLKALFGH